MGRLGARLLPYALGYALSYLLRSANAVLADPLARDLGLSPAALGGLTASFYLAFALGQLPLGGLLDRYGPRRVLFPLLLVAGLGSLLFALGRGFTLLLVGRGLMGAGVALALVGAIRAYQLHSPQRMGALSGFTVALGGLGGLLATSPLAYAGENLGWRGAFLLLALLAMALALLGLGVAPRDPLAGEDRLGRGPRGGPAGMASRAFQGKGSLRRGAGSWRGNGVVAAMGLVAFAYIGGFFAVQSLWAGAYAYEMGLEGSWVGRWLLVLNAASIGGGVLAGVLAGLLGTGRSLGMGVALFSLGLVLWALGAPLPLAYALVGLGGGFNAMVLAQTASLAADSAGRAMALVNVTGVSGIFAIQTSFGLAVERVGYPVALLGLALFQGLALVGAMRIHREALGRGSRP
ncbi:Probable sulfoacetate transporter SauU (plasmid) [Thermus thermophilus]|uniref:Probable sulfoacetate transporter SauU n=1 Tax=Thermus thermophilus TaxID=274 RepID=A0A3P4AXC2_THETH|nr:MULTISPECIES: MFS transporter [Thermus]VCU54653.1 Probable sulfoacetate transporter SauU [Thermus thermophilus]